MKTIFENETGARLQLSYDCAIDDVMQGKNEHANSTLVTIDIEKISHWDSISEEELHHPDFTPYVCMTPEEARHLAHALIDYADAADEAFEQQRAKVVYTYTEATIDR